MSDLTLPADTFAIDETLLTVRVLLLSVNVKLLLPTKLEPLMNRICVSVWSIAKAPNVVTSIFAPELGGEVNTTLLPTML